MRRENVLKISRGEITKTFSDHWHKGRGAVSGTLRQTNTSVSLLDICRILVLCGRLIATKVLKGKQKKKKREEGMGHEIKTVRNKRRKLTNLKSYLKSLTTLSQKKINI